MSHTETGNPIRRPLGGSTKFKTSCLFLQRFLNPKTPWRPPSSMRHVKIPGAAAGTRLQSLRYRAILVCECGDRRFVLRCAALRGFTIRASSLSSFSMNYRGESGRKDMSAQICRVRTRQPFDVGLIRNQCLPLPAICSIGLAVHVTLELDIWLDDSVIMIFDLVP